MYMNKGNLSTFEQMVHLKLATNEIQNIIHPTFQTSLISGVSRFGEGRQEETVLITIYVIMDFSIKDVGVPQHSDLTCKPLPQELFPDLT